jgi:hypothetical protein
MVALVTCHMIWKAKVTSGERCPMHGCSWGRQREFSAKDVQGMAALVSECREGNGNFRLKVAKAWLVWLMHGEGKGSFRPKVSKA